jgi:hypothetical protein
VATVVRLFIWLSGLRIVKFDWSSCVQWRAAAGRTGRADGRAADVAAVMLTTWLPDSYRSHQQKNVKGTCLCDTYSRGGNCPCSPNNRAVGQPQHLLGKHRLPQQGLGKVGMSGR